MNGETTEKRRTNRGGATKYVFMVCAIVLSVGLSTVRDTARKSKPEVGAPAEGVRAALLAFSGIDLVTEFQVSETRNGSLPVAINYLV